jgi:DNA-binding YbaB/EbfC family protein
VSQPPFDLSGLLKQAKEIQGRLAEAQGRLRHRTVEATVGGGMVTATANGRLELVRLSIDPSVVNAGDVEMLQDLVVAAVNEVMRRAQEVAREEIQQVTGFPIPNLLGGGG